MKTTNIILAALLFSTGVILSQNSNKPVTVRIKKIENVNGVKTVIDTTYTTTDLSSVPEFDNNVLNINLEEINNGVDKTMEITTNLPGVTEIDAQIAEDGDWVSKDMEEGIKIGDTKKQNECNKKIVIVRTNDNTKSGNERVGPQKTKVIIIKNVKCVEVTESELGILGKKSAPTDKRLELTQLHAYPNPNNGLLGLTLEIAKKGATDISIYNGSGQLVFEEKLENFTGLYEKQIDISANPKGIYFVTVKQNNESITKKLILE